MTTRRLFVAILFVALFVMTTREISDPDFWWHLSTGKYIVETQSIPHTDPFSFTKAGEPWVTHEWLSEVVMYALFLVGSYPLLILTFSAIITLSFAFVFARSQGKPYIATLALLLAALTTAPTWGVRPQMISLLLMSVFLWVLDKSHCHVERSETSLNQGNETLRAVHPEERRTQSDKLLWLLPPLMLLWVNLHSGYALGLAILVVYLFGAIVSRITHSESDSHPPKLTATLALVFVLCMVAVLFNPNGATMFIYPFETLTSRTMQAYIQEWFSPDFHLSEFQPFAWLILATMASIALSGKRASLTQTLLLIGTGYAALRSARNIPLFAVVAAPILAEHLWYIVEARFRSMQRTTAPITRSMAIVNWVLLAVIVLAGLLRVAMVASNQQAVERAKFPAAAVDFLQTHVRNERITGALYNSYGWGGYLIWRMYPQVRVFIDGRADVYGDQFIEDVYLKGYRGGDGWLEPLDRYDVHFVLVEPDAPLASPLASDAAWRKVYEDKQAVVWERK
ncbi:MAG: hypothetical protein HZB51_05675 [Chloroflexi bacterium]|nr:hypothetical protein [Chloroflexota bacterium]